ncbi:MAG: hypothetical protein ABI399_13410 [Bauldia sp.]
MRLFGRGLSGSAARLAATLGAAALLAGFLAACTSSGDSGGESGTSNFLKMLKTGGADTRTDAVSEAYLAQSSYCPTIQIRGGAEALSFYEKGHDGDPAYVRYLASVGKTARECHNNGADYSIKIGVAGRVVAGPKGNAGAITVPLRIAVAHQFGAALYTELFKIPVTLSPPDFGADFSQVVNATVQIGPDDRDLLVFIGFDDGKPPKKPAPPEPTG